MLELVVWIPGIPLCEMDCSLVVSRFKSQTMGLLLVEAWVQDGPLISYMYDYNCTYGDYNPVTNLQGHIGSYFCWQTGHWLKG